MAEHTNATPDEIIAAQERYLSWGIAAYEFPADELRGAVLGRIDNTSFLTN
jgi:hypothetical protein